MQSGKAVKLCILLWFLFWIPYLSGKDSLAEIYGCFGGWKACAECHDTETKGWQKTRHAVAFESLKKSGQQDLPDCIQCHVVGYDKYGGFLDHELTPELAGVQCENCHGPDKEHIQNPDDGKIIAVPEMELCRKCHTAIQDPGFDYAEKVKFSHGD
ncbi:MAG: cytochrome c family protein [Deltaproteobacteria bacterium]|nr:cytochrome c family protein [Deltaproteobacteria bacterium]